MTFTVKSNENSERHRKSGNKHFDRGEFYEALLSYNSSICHAELDSRTLALAYGNRSAVYFKAFMYDKCLENIELAKASGFPRDKMSKLRKREQDCNDMIVDHGSGFCFDPWSFFKLSYPTHKKIPFIVNHLELKENEKYGRHIITSYDLSAGDIIAIEEPLFKSLNHDARQSHCYYCLKSNKLSLIPCPSCSSGKINIQLCFRQRFFHVSHSQLCIARLSVKTRTLCIKTIVEWNPTRISLK